MHPSLLRAQREQAKQPARPPAKSTARLASVKPPAPTAPPSDKLQLLPEELWREIWKYLPLKHLCKVEVVNQAFRRRVLARPTPDFPKLRTDHQCQRQLTAIAANKRLCGALSKFKVRYHTWEAIGRHWPPLIANFRSLTDFELTEGNSFSILNDLSRSGCPLRTIYIDSRSVKDFYTRIDEGGFARLKPTLENLALLDNDRTVLAPPQLLAAIATHLGGTLLSLYINCEKWAELRQMGALQLLAIRCPSAKTKAYFNPTALEESVSVLRDQSPRQIGVEVYLSSDYSYSSYLGFLLKHPGVSPANAPKLLQRYGASSNTRILDGRGRNETSLVWDLLVSQRLDNCKLLIENGLDLSEVQAYGLRRSIFAEAMERAFKLPPTPEAVEFHQWIFGKPWTEARKRHSALELLKFDPRDGLRHFLARVDPYSDRGFKDPAIFEFILSRGDVFGAQDLWGVDAMGCNLAHHCADGVGVAFLKKHKVDFKHRDKAGRDAIECLAQRVETVVGHLLTEANTTDEDFIAHATPLVWGAVAKRASTTESEVREVVERMVRLVPMRMWEPLIRASIHVQIRMPWEETLQVYFSIAEPAKFRQVVLRSLFGNKWTDVLASDWFRHYQISDHKVREHTAHCLISHYSGRPLFDAVDEWFRGQDHQRLAFFSAKNRKGLTYLEDMVIRHQGPAKAYESSARKCWLYLANVDGLGDQMKRGYYL